MADGQSEIAGNDGHRLRQMRWMLTQTEVFFNDLSGSGTEGLLCCHEDGSLDPRPTKSSIPHNICNSSSGL